MQHNYKVKQSAKWQAMAVIESYKGYKQEITVNTPEDSYKRKAVQAVETAFTEAFKHYAPELAENIQNAIIDSCTRNARFSFERAAVVGVSKSSFYLLKNRVVFLVAQKMGF